MKIKDQGQVFTPKHIVDDILNIATYSGEHILNKHVIDNSCGDGAFLIGFIERYREAYMKKNGTSKGLKQKLQKYIHGIEKDETIYHMCLDNLNRYASENNLGTIKWDILNSDSLDVECFNGMMDYVIGNPPYVRVHNLKAQHEKVKQYSFCESGMTDLYILFFEIGIKMLKKNGVLCYITPNSFCNSVAGRKLRTYLQEKQNLECLYDLGHYQPFNVSTYTIISKICHDKKFRSCQYYKYNEETEQANYICDIDYHNLFIDNKVVLSSNNEAYFKYLNYKMNPDSKVQVKNGFATLHDGIFIQDTFPFEHNVIDVIKGSTGQWKKCLYPYDSDGKLIPFIQLDQAVQKYLKHHKSELTKNDTKTDSLWYGFGRSQAIHDVYHNKISINTTIKDISSIKLHEVTSGKGVYSGLYLLTDIPFQTIKQIVCSEKFIQYLKIVNKCKSGGYFTFSSKDLAKFINCEWEEYYE